MLRLPAAGQRLTPHTAMYCLIGADGREYGPVPRDTVLQWVREGRVQAQTWARQAGASGWQPLGSLPEFAEAFRATGQTAAAPPIPSPITPLRVSPRTNPMATAGFVMGLLAVTCGCCCCYGFPFNLLGVVFSLIALSQINQAPGGESGRGLAIGGLVLSLASVAIAVLAALVGFVMSLPGLHHGPRRW